MRPRDPVGACISGSVARPAWGLSIGTIRVVHAVEPHGSGLSGAGTEPGSIRWPRGDREVPQPSYWSKQVDFPHIPVGLLSCRFCESISIFYTIYNSCWRPFLFLIASRQIPSIFWSILGSWLWCKWTIIVLPQPLQLLPERCFTTILFGNKHTSRSPVIIWGCNTLFMTRWTQGDDASLRVLG